MTRKISYKLYSVKRPADVNWGPMMSGLYGWQRVFEEHGLGGVMDASIIKEELETHGIIHVNVTAGNLSYINGIRAELGEHSSTKIIANVDHAINHWHNYDLHLLKSVLDKADFVFHVEPVGAAALARLLGRKVECIPHPVDVKSIKAFRKKERKPVISCQYHRYNNTWQEYFRGLLDTRKRWPEARTVLMNLEIPEGQKHATVPVNSFFSDTVGRLPYPAYLKLLSESLINIDVTPDYTQGRGIVDAAAMGVPTIGTPNQAAMDVLYTYDKDNDYGDYDMRCTYDEGMDEIATKLLSDEEYRENMAEMGMENAEYYSYKNSYERMVKALENTKVI